MGLPWRGSTGGGGTAPRFSWQCAGGVVYYCSAPFYIPEVR